MSSSQVLPPFWAAWLRSFTLVCIPCPQLTLHLEYSPNSLHVQSTKINVNCANFFDWMRNQLSINYFEFWMYSRMYLLGQWCLENRAERQNPCPPILFIYPSKSSALHLDHFLTPELLAFSFITVLLWGHLLPILENLGDNDFDDPLLWSCLIPTSFAKIRLSAW